jgi:hypothetical protein
MSSPNPNFDLVVSNDVHHSGPFVFHLEITNSNMIEHIAYKVCTSTAFHPFYHVTPNPGIIGPHETVAVEIQVHLQAEVRGELLVIGDKEMKPKFMIRKVEQSPKRCFFILMVFSYVCRSQMLSDPEDKATASY